MLRSDPFPVWLDSLADAWVSEPLDAFCDWVDYVLGWDSWEPQEVPQAQEPMPVSAPSPTNRQWWLRSRQGSLSERIVWRGELDLLKADRAVLQINQTYGDRFQVIFRDGYSMPVNPALHDLKWKRRAYV
jgi:hypothetical protein